MTLAYFLFEIHFQACFMIDRCSIMWYYVTLNFALNYQDYSWDGIQTYAVHIFRSIFE